MEADLAKLSHLLKRLWFHLSRRRRRQLVLVFGLVLVSAFAEMMSLGAVLPFLGVLTAPEKMFQKYPLIADLARSWGVHSAGQLILPMTLAFGLTALMAGVIRLLFLWVNTRLSNACGADLSIEAYRRTLYQPYSVHVARNSSIVISGLNKVSVAESVLQSVIVMVSSIILSVTIMATLLVINAMVAMAAAIIIGISYGLVVWLLRRKLAMNSRCIAQESTNRIKALQEGLGGIRDILLDGTQPAYCDIYRRSQVPLMRAQGDNAFIGLCPRYIMEALGMVLVAGLGYSLSRQGGVASAIPVLGALALGAQRMLPAIQQFYGGWANIAGNQAVLTDVLALLDQPLSEEAHEPNPKPLSFAQSIHFNDVWFRYGDDSPWVLEGFELTIPKGARVGFIGSTGSGKSTALDLLMGLLDPVRGQVLVDDLPIRGMHRRAWQRAIAHVPQSIYLADASLAENIAFGVSQEAIDMERVRAAARQAQISDFIERQPDGYRSYVGERGVRLSGGQRQRIGIARALYKQADVIIFDEATSALDNETERAVMQAIEGLSQDLTILIIAHRLTTLRNCTQVVELGNRGILRMGSYQDVVSQRDALSRGYA